MFFTIINIVQLRQETILKHKFKGQIIALSLQF